MTGARRAGRSMARPNVPGAASHGQVDWSQIDWNRANKNVWRLQARIAKATGEGRWGKVRCLQHLLTHSYSGKVLAVKRVTTNRGKRTPGVDGEIWTTSAQKSTAVQRLRSRGYQPLRTRADPESGRRIQGELHKLGRPRSHGIVRKVMLLHRVPPAPRRLTRTWEEFVRQHAAHLLATDFQRGDGFARPS
jgi:RNA-directed DNA polymerase